MQRCRENERYASQQRKPEKHARKWTIGGPFLHANNSDFSALLLFAKVLFIDLLQLNNELMLHFIYPCLRFWSRFDDNIPTFPMKALKTFLKPLNTLHSPQILWRLRLAIHHNLIGRIRNWTAPDTIFHFTGIIYPSHIFYLLITYKMHTQRYLVSIHMLQLLFSSTCNAFQCMFCN